MTNKTNSFSSSNSYKNEDTMSNLKKALKMRMNISGKVPKIPQMLQNTRNKFESLVPHTQGKVNPLPVNKKHSSPIEQDTPQTIKHLGEGIQFLKTKNKQDDKIVIDFSKIKNVTHSHPLEHSITIENPSENYKSFCNLHIFRARKDRSIYIFNDKGELINQITGANIYKNNFFQKKKKYHKIRHDIRNVLHNSSEVFSIIERSRVCYKTSDNDERRVGINDLKLILINKQGKQIGKYLSAHAHEIYESGYVRIATENGIAYYYIDQNDFGKRRLELNNFGNTGEKITCDIKKDLRSGKMNIHCQKTGVIIAEVEGILKQTVINVTNEKGNSYLIDTDGNKISKEYKDLDFNENENTFYSGKRYETSKLANFKGKLSHKAVNLLLKGIDRLLPDTRKNIRI